MELENESQVLIAETCHFLLTQLGDIGVANKNGTRIGGVERSHNLEESGLSCTTWSYDTHHFAFFNLQVDAFQHLQGAKALGDIS